MPADWSTIAIAFAAGGFPWISQLKQLPIHFALPDLDLSAIFNFFASLFAVSVFAFCVYAHPLQVIEMPRWYWLVGAAFMLTAIYFSLFLYWRASVTAGTTRWPVIVNFIVYVLIFVTLTAGFGVLKLLDPYTLVEGTVVAGDNTAVANAEVEVTNQQDYFVTALTDEDGRFVLLLEKEPAKGLTQASITKDGTRRQITFSSAFSVPTTLRRVVLQ